MTSSSSSDGSSSSFQTHLFLHSSYIEGSVNKNAFWSFLIEDGWDNVDPAHEQKEFFQHTRHVLPLDRDVDDATRNKQHAEWRNKDRLKTVSAILVSCLNIGVDPPDVVKPKPCARTECWVDTGTYYTRTTVSLLLLSFISFLPMQCI